MGNLVETHGLPTKGLIREGENPNAAFGGWQCLYRFANGLGALVSWGSEYLDAGFALIVVKWHGPGDSDYETLTDDVDPPNAEGLCEHAVVMCLEAISGKAPLPGLSFLKCPHLREQILWWRRARVRGSIRGCRR